MLFSIQLKSNPVSGILLRFTNLSTDRPCDRLLRAQNIYLKLIFTRFIVFSLPTLAILLLEKKMIVNVLLYIQDPLMTYCERTRCYCYKQPSHSCTQHLLCCCYSYIITYYVLTLYCTN